MTNPATIVLGPLAGVECRRAVARGWLILVRVLAASAILFATLLPLWYWEVALRIEPLHRPFHELRIGLIAVEWMLVTIALVLGPAVLAGSLAGEKERGVLALLLTTRVNSYEIAAGRLAGKLTQIAMILLAGLPGLILLASLAGMRAPTVLVLMGLPTAVGLGGGGLAAMASTLSRRGRDALLSVYLIDLLLMLSPLADAFGTAGISLDALAVCNPYTVVRDLAYGEALGPALASIGVWTCLGAFGLAVAAWRLRPCALAPLDGERTARRGGRRWFVPPVDEVRPMLWKELFIERVGTLGRFGKWVGLLLVVSLIGVSLGMLATLMAAGLRGDAELSTWAVDQLGIWVGLTGSWVCIMIQGAVGLRAAVSISSERERGTWDALLTSPLEAGEIVRGKLWGSLHAIRWLILSAVVAWICAAAAQAIPLREAVNWTLEILVIGAFMAAVGVRTSLSCQTATKAMSITVGAWLGALVVVLMASVFLLALAFLLYLAGWMAIYQPGLNPAAPAPPMTTPISASTFMEIVSLGLYLLLTLAVVADTRVRFDRIAGRMTEGGVSLAADAFLYGRNEAPEFVVAEEQASPVGSTSVGPDS